MPENEDYLRLIYVSIIIGAVSLGGLILLSPPKRKILRLIAFPIYGIVFGLGIMLADMLGWTPNFIQ